MARAKRKFVGNQVYHVLNRGNARADIFATATDYAAFEMILRQALERFSMRLCCYCLMPNHWHLCLWPRQRQGDDVSAFMQWLTLTHTRRWHACHGTTGHGHLYQGRFKSFPVQGDGHILKVFRYVEQNALRAKLVSAAEKWPYGSLWQRANVPVADRHWLSDWPVPQPSDWLVSVNRIPDAAQLEALRLASRRGRPFGSRSWTLDTASRLGLESSLRLRGRPPLERSAAVALEADFTPIKGT
ncbi:MAG: hypothetical protein HKL95_03700 [Phycisphaerae bacterium]|nr:hypothetical protein [Phycisphaerae bacterium]